MEDEVTAILLRIQRLAAIIEMDARRPENAARAKEISLLVDSLRKRLGERVMGNIDWKAEMKALDESLPEQLERVARMAETSNRWTDEERLMPATGVADILYEALDEIRQHRGRE